MPFLFDVAQVFDKCVESVCQKNPEYVKLGPDFARFVKEHPRRYVVLNNLCDQVVRFEKGFSPSKQTVDRRNGMILSVAKMFVKAARVAHEQSLMSEAERIRIAHKNQPLEDMKEIVKELDEDGNVSPL